MTALSIGILAITMSIDAFIAALGTGASAVRPSLARALKAGLVFGLIEAVTPLIGWAAGVAAGPYVARVDHWIAFALLAAVGLRMILQATRPDDGRPARPSASLWTTIVIAFGTSIDAMIVGVSLAFIDANIFVVAGAIGVSTMILSSTGILAGRYLGHRFGRVAEAIGGGALILLGASILASHLAAG
ncbi:manganese efflux pump MntP family protein [Chachezhania antarctica]|uniref:manganese efflux pump MntP n=1 Tax=Chachezhania antarctica TaxID=2340860 RepID=UPI000EADF8B1|nr:manganese efflux pump MntP family protein [Chachezhania antarctica]|tara:strand:- start:1171 stop:1734 length:564 start_codon:yes stop_codon:yes gene_type:complete